MQNEPEDDAERYDDWPLGEYPPPPCPTCGRESTPIVYGMPGLGLTELADRGAVILGGCVVDGDEPTHRCRAGHEWEAQPPASHSPPGRARSARIPHATPWPLGKRPG